MNVSIIGSGNVATVMGRQIMRSGHTVQAVAGRNEEAVRKLAEELSAIPVTELPHIPGGSDIYLICVSDSVIETVSSRLNFGDALVLHTSGATPMQSLSTASSKYGVLYPLQSLRKELRSLPEIPFLVDGNNVETRTAIEVFAKTLSARVSFAGDRERLHMHLAAVIVSNFSNHLYALTDAYCRSANLDFGLLHALIREVALRIEQDRPENLQTGPAVRGDLSTINKHLELLKDQPRLRKIYALMTESIISLQQKP